jgi:RNA polymerase sigma-70 factor (ECF subfamily)
LSIADEAGQPALFRTIRREGTMHGQANTLQHDDDGDRHLLHRISCADRDAFERLFLDYHKRLVRFLCRVIRRDEDLEEVINDTFLIVWRRAGDSRGASRVSTWIFGIAYRCALKAIRRSTIRSRAAALVLQHGEPIVEDAAKRTEDRQLLDLGLSRLPPEQRLVFTLAYCMDYSCEEIAAIVECPVNTVKSRMWQARRKLRTIICAAAAPQGIVVGGDGGAQPEGLALLQRDR